MRIYFDFGTDGDIDEFLGFVAGLLKVHDTSVEIRSGGVVTATFVAEDFADNMMTIVSEPYFHGVDFEVKYF
jgi:hypothetical protein